MTKKGLKNNQKVGQLRSFQAQKRMKKELEDKQAMVCVPFGVGLFLEVTMHRQVGCVGAENCQDQRMARRRDRTKKRRLCCCGRFHLFAFISDQKNYIFIFSIPILATSLSSLALCSLKHQERIKNCLFTSAVPYLTIFFKAPAEHLFMSKL